MKRRRLLIVDDEPDILRVLRLRFETKGYEVSTAPDGDIAIELFQQRRPHAVLIDIHMPHLDGIEVLREMLELDPQANVIVISGHITPLQTQLALEEGARHFIPKPIDFERLEAAVETDTAPPARWKRAIQRALQRRTGATRR